MVDDKKFASLLGKTKKIIPRGSEKGFYMELLAPNSTKDGTASDVTVTGEIFWQIFDVRYNFC